MINEGTLPVSGRAYSLRRPTGRDMVESEIIIGKDGGAIALQMAILSRVTSIDGKVLPYQDFLDLDAEDLDHLGKLEVKYEKSAPEQSLPSQGSHDGHGQS
jgi:hypothetical protein